MNSAAQVSGGEEPYRPLSRDAIEQALRRVGEYLTSEQLQGEILILGGAYMTLVLRQREATKDVDAYIPENAQAVRAAAARVAHEFGLPEDWLNNAVKGFLFTQPEVTVWAEFPGLRVYAPDPAYVFALKVYAGRPEDQRDVLALREVLKLPTAKAAMDIVRRYIPAQLLTPRVQYFLEDLFE